jgi:hypothetical protein
MLTTATHDGRSPRDSSQEPTRRDSIDEDTRHRAHEIFLSRKGVPGSELDDWLRAEREIESLACQTAVSMTQRLQRKPRGIQTILRFLRLQGVYVSGPMQESDGTLVFRVGDFVLTDAQLVELMVKQKPTGQGIKERAK